jgi:hypothetical protein
MTVATILSGVRTAIAVTLVPASIVGGVCAALWAMNSGIDPVMVIFPISLASLVLVIVMERILPYRREWNHSHGDLRTDALYYLTQFVVGGLLAPVLGALTIIIGGWLSAQMGGSIWPYGWPILAQVLLATVVREFFDYWAHPVEIAYRFSLVWVLPLAVLGVTRTSAGTGDRGSGGGRCVPATLFTYCPYFILAASPKQGVCFQDTARAIPGASS